MADVSLVYLPYGSLERPSLALSILKNCVLDAGISCELDYTTFEFAEMIGSAIYSDLVWVKGEMMGEWTFAGAAFPEFEADHAAYFRQVISTYAPDDKAEGEKIESLLWRVRKKATLFIDKKVQDVLASRPKIVACSSTFNQQTAVLAFTRRIKQLDPSIITVVGGGNCEGEMGLAMIRTFPWLDYVVSGEAENLLPDLCRANLDTKRKSYDRNLPYGVFGAPNRDDICRESETKSIPRAMVDDLDTSPMPDFDDYFAALDKYKGKYLVNPGLLIETSRGCWWGETSHCTFCGLNGGGMSYRSKSPERAISEFSLLAEKYGIHRFLVVDNILDLKYFKTVIPALADDPKNYTLFYEIKANVSYEQLVLLKNAGVTWLQPGIESLHDKVLDLMRKGTRTWINIQLLKYARQLGLSIGWNLLCGFPGEEDYWYAEMAEKIPLIEHLEPSTELRLIRFDRFSPYQANAKSYNLDLQPAWPYKFIYPVSESILSDLIYLLEDKSRPPLQTNPLRLRKQGLLPSLGGAGKDKLQDAIRNWHDAFLLPVPPVLSMVEGQQATVITDTRSIAIRSKITLTGLLHRVHRACFHCESLPNICKAIAADGPPADENEIRLALKELESRKLILIMDKRYLALSLRGEVPDIPKSHRQGYPGGWVDRPTRSADNTKVPTPAQNAEPETVEP